MKDLEKWRQIQSELCSYFGICYCQRKLKSIIDDLHSIYIKCESCIYDFTGAEYLLIALIDSQHDAFEHGINCEYPYINKSSLLWEIVAKYKDDPALEDN